MKTLGAVLAGGRSSRFGSDKALAMLGGRTLLDHASAALGPHCDALVIVGRDGGIADWPRPAMGPLGAFAGALGHAAVHGFGQVLTAPVDCVRLPADLRALLNPAPAFLTSQPVIGLWPVAALGELKTMLEADGDLAVRAFARRIGARGVESDFVPPNVNSVADLDRLAGDLS